MEEDKAGKSIAARIAMMAITTSNSIKVKAAGPGLCPAAPDRWKRFSGERVEFGSLLSVRFGLFILFCSETGSPG